MDFSNDEKRIIKEFRTLDDVVQQLILSSLDAFAKWMKDKLYSIYLKIKDAIKDFWKWLVKKFR